MQCCMLETDSAQLPLHLSDIWPCSLQVFSKEISLTKAMIESSVDQTLVPGTYTVTVTPVPSEAHAAVASYQTFQGSINVLPSEADVQAAANQRSHT